MQMIFKLIKGSRWGALGSVGISTLMVAAPISTMAIQSPVQDSSAQEQKVAPDNSKKNVRDRKDQNPTPMDQGGSAGDLKITKDIRQEINHKKEISTNGKNVKIITIDGAVTLRGPVATEEEKQLIYDIASKIAGSAKVKNELEVKSRKY